MAREEDVSAAVEAGLEAVDWGQVSRDVDAYSLVLLVEESIRAAIEHLESNFEYGVGFDKRRIFGFETRAAAEHSLLGLIVDGASPRLIRKDRNGNIEDL